MSNVTILDYGAGNLLNVARAFRHCGAEVDVTTSPAAALRAPRLLLPGVGAFADAMGQLRATGFAAVLREYADSGRPLLGICLGMQMLFEQSEEFGTHEGIGLFQGAVRRLPARNLTGEPQRVPHIGWNHLVPPADDRSWSGTLLSPFVGRSPAVYFVHSYAASPAHSADRLADCLYGGHRVCAAVQRANLMGTQFHPERSGLVGLAVLRHFLSLPT